MPADGGEFKGFTTSKDLLGFVGLSDDFTGSLTLLRVDGLVDGAALMGETSILSVFCIWDAWAAAI